jgi:hypothetical protein
MVIKYIGFSHFRELFPEDFQKWGVNPGEHIIFARWTPTDIIDAEGQAILDHLSDEFVKVTTTMTTDAPLPFSFDEPAE